MPYISYENDSPLSSSIHISNEHGNNFAVTPSCNVESVHIPTGECDECEAFENQVRQLQGEIGNLNNLQTAHKDNLVNAINDANSGGGGVTVDTYLDANSSNPVENSAIYAGLTTKVPYPHSGGGLIYGNDGQVLASDGTPNGTKWVNVSGSVPKAAYNVWGTILASGSHDPGGGYLRVTYNNNGNDTPVDLVALSASGKIARDQLQAATTSAQGAVILDTTLANSGRAADAKAVGDLTGSLANLTTTANTSLVAAINETDKFFIAEYNVTDYFDTQAAYNAGKIIIMKNGDDYLLLTSYDGTGFDFYEFVDNGRCYKYRSHYSGWGTSYWNYVPTLRKVNNKTLVSDITLTSTDVDAVPRPSSVGTDGQVLVIRTGGGGWWTEWAAVSGGGTQNVWYGTCTNQPGTVARTVTTSTGDFTLTTGNVVYVLMSSSSAYGSITLDVDSTGAKDLYVRYSSAGTNEDSYGNMWQPGEVLCCVYDGTRFIAIGKTRASSSEYGITKLDTTLATTGLAADAKAVGDAMPTSASIDSSGLITFKNAANTSVFTLQLPIYNGGVNP